ncbi:MAG: hypothetical protein ABI423_06725 [Burkholderiales bacterium]
MNLRPDQGQTVQLDEIRRRELRRERWRLKRAAEGLLRNTPVEHCCRSVIGGAVYIRQAEGERRAFYHNIAKCKSRWGCPVCAPQLTERDQVKLRDALTIWKSSGGETYLVTFTIRHDRSMPTRDAVKGLLAAQNKMKAWRAYKAIMNRAGAAGSITAREISFGENGPHPHVHMLILAKPGMLDELGKVRELWADAVRRQGLEDVNEHGFDVRGGDYAAEYVAKYGKEPSADSKRTVRAWWNVSDEMTRGHTKQTRRLGGATPFTLLRWYADGDKEAGAVFADYFDTMRGRSQLHWSKGLRAKLDLFCLERAEVEKPKARNLVQIDFDTWGAVLRHNGRWELLYVAEQYGPDAVEVLLDRMRRSPGRWRGDFRTTDPLSGRWMPGYYEPLQAAA